MGAEPLSDGINYRLGPVYYRIQRGEDQHQFNSSVVGKRFLSTFSPEALVASTGFAIGNGHKTVYSEGYVLRLPKKHGNGLTGAIPKCGFSATGIDGHDAQAVLSCLDYSYGISNVTAPEAQEIFQSLHDDDDDGAARENQDNFWINDKVTTNAVLDFLLVQKGNPHNYPIGCRYGLARELGTGFMSVRGHCSQYGTVTISMYIPIILAVIMYVIKHTCAIWKNGIQSYLSDAGKFIDLMNLIVIFIFLSLISTSQAMAITTFWDAWTVPLEEAKPMTQDATVRYIDGLQVTDRALSALAWSLIILTINLIRHLSLVPLTQLPLKVLQHAKYLCFVLIIQSCLVSGSIALSFYMLYGTQSHQIQSLLDAVITITSILTVTFNLCTSWNSQPSEW